MKPPMYLATPWIFAAVAGAQTARPQAQTQTPVMPQSTTAPAAAAVQARPRLECELPPLPELAPTGWTGGVLYFEFDANVTATNKGLMYAAMDSWNYSGARVAFVPRTAGVNSNYMHIEDGAANYSTTIGMPNGQATIQMYNWNYRFIMAHELCHALGFWHEQARPDRDPYITIVGANICCNQSSQFSPVSASNWFPILTPYDFDSVMHYGQCAFTVCSSCSGGCETIVCDPPYTSWQGSIGQRDHLSTNDVLDMKNAYGTGLGPRYVVPGYGGAPTGSLVDPYWNVAEVNAYSPAASTVYFQSGTYDEGVITISKQTVIAPFGGVVTLR